MTTISEKNKQIIAEAFSEAFGGQDTKNEFHGRLFGKLANLENGKRPTSIDVGVTQPEDNSSEFQKLLEHSQDFRSFTKTRFEQGFTQTETDNQKK